MKTVLIAYSSKTGTAAECVRMLERELKSLRVTVADLDRGAPELRGCDAVVFGSSVRFGKLRPAAARFLAERGGELAALPHGLFLCCGFGHEFEAYSQRLFPQNLRDSAFAVLSFGGRLRLEKASWPEKLLLNRVRASILRNDADGAEWTPALPDILPENISRMADALRSAL